MAAVDETPDVGTCPCGEEIRYQPNVTGAKCRQCGVLHRRRLWKREAVIRCEFCGGLGVVPMVEVCGGALEVLYPWCECHPRADERERTHQGIFKGLQFKWEWEQWCEKHSDIAYAAWLHRTVLGVADSPQPWAPTEEREPGEE